MGKIQRSQDPYLSFARKLGSLIRAQRTKKGLTGAELAKLADPKAAYGLSKSSICRIESGDRLPNLFQLVVIAEALEIDKIDVSDWLGICTDAAFYNAQQKEIGRDSRV